jgi:hypothetical protein
MMTVSWAVTPSSHVITLLTHVCGNGGFNNSGFGSFAAYTKRKVII